MLEMEKDWDGNKKQPKRMQINRKKETDGDVDGKFKWQQFVLVANLGDTFLVCGFIQFNSLQAEQGRD
jgi:hypothetical protein